MKGNANLIQKKGYEDRRILLVGAGGVGCEVLKNLAVTGFKHITVVDLDTIELSNLNRQFLFRKKHIGKPKSTVAATAIKAMKKDVEIEAFNENIKSNDFDTDWYCRFDIVINALDNLEARRHVNFMCQAANVPLIETGTAGYTGQTTVIKRGITECYECQPKPTEQKTYPVCTIRNTPTALIHCVVWAKDFFMVQLFGSDEEKNTEISDANEDIDGKEEEKMQSEVHKLAKISGLVGAEHFDELVFDCVFKNSIEESLLMEDMWKSRAKPTPLSFSDFQNGNLAENTSIDIRKTPSIEECFKQWKDSIQKLKKRHLVTTNGKFSAIKFDKDDDDCLSFVASSANIRAHIFGIEKQSTFSIKAMAGNIIPSIATINSIVSGLAVGQTLKTLAGDIDKCKTIYFSYTSQNRLLANSKLLPPNLECPVCNAQYLKALTDLSKKRLCDVIDALLGKSGGNPLIQGLNSDFIITKGKRILYDFDFEDNLEKPLSDLGIQDGTFLTFTFESEDDDITIHPLVIFFYNRPSIDNDNQLELVSTAKNLGGTNGISERLNSCKKRKLSETDSDLKEEAFSHPSGNAKKARLDTEVSNHLVIEDSDDDHVEQNASLNSAVFIVDDSD